MQAKCFRTNCRNSMNRRGPSHKFCSRKCAELVRNALTLHESYIFTAAELSKLGKGLVLVRFGITSPTSDLVRWFPGPKSHVPRLGMPIPMINLPYEQLPGTGLYNLAFYSADGSLEMEPSVRLSMTFPAAKDLVPFSWGVPYKHQKLGFSEGLAPFDPG